MKVKFEFEGGIVSGDAKRLVEGYNTGFSFVQRKSYDEYYPKSSVEVHTSLEVLSLISEHLKVQVHRDTITLSEY